MESPSLSSLPSFSLKEKGRGKRREKWEDLRLTVPFFLLFLEEKTEKEKKDGRFNPDPTFHSFFCRSLHLPFLFKEKKEKEERDDREEAITRDT